MRTVSLGEELEVSALGLGCMGMSEFYGEADDAESLRVEENLGALDVKLDEEDLAAIEAVAPKGAFAGERYPDMGFVSGVTPTRG